MATIRRIFLWSETQQEIGYSYLKQCSQEKAWLQDGVFSYGLKLSKILGTLI